MRYKITLYPKGSKYNKRIVYYTFEELKEKVYKSTFWENPYTRPDMRSLKDVCRVYFTDYDVAKITRQNY